MSFRAPPWGLKQSHSTVFNKSFLRVRYVPGTVPGTGDAAKNIAEKVSAFRKLREGQR